MNRNGSDPDSIPNNGCMAKVRLRAVNIVMANRRRPYKIVNLEPYFITRAVRREMPSVKTIISGFVRRNRAVYPGTTTPPGESSSLSYQIMLTTMPMNIPRLRTVLLTAGKARLVAPPLVIQ